MGNGEVVGNQSVHWKIDHEKADKALTARPGRKERPTGDDEVHVDKVCMGRDPKPISQIGKGERKGYFNVRLRFDNASQARMEMEQAVSKGKDDGKGNFYVEVDVRAVERKHPEDDPKAEVHIDW